MYYRDDKYLVFDDKFGVSKNHLDIIPTQVIADISALTEEHIPMLEQLYALGKAELVRRKVPVLLDMGDDALVAGYNFPVSVKHLHLHMVCGPFSHEKVFQYPRWHPHSKVVSDLKQYGKVRTYAECPDPEAGAASYERAMASHNRALKLLEEAASSASAVQPNL